MSSDPATYDQVANFAANTSNQLNVIIIVTAITLALIGFVVVVGLIGIAFGWSYYQPSGYQSGSGKTGTYGGNMGTPQGNA